MRRLSLYKKSLILFSILLIGLGFVFLAYVYNSLVIYERSLVDNYIKYLAESGKLTDNINDDLFEISPYEKDNAQITEGIKGVLKSDDLVIKKNSKECTDKLYVYDLKVDDQIVSKVTLKNVNTYTKMAILSVNEWDVVNVETFFDKGIYSYEINIPSKYHLYINGNEARDKDITKEGDIEELERVTKHVEISKRKTYEINNLVYEPKIKVVDENNKEVKYEKNGHKIEVLDKFKTFKTIDEAKAYLKEDFDVLKLAKNWSLFLTDDLPGTFHGFYELTPYLIKDTYMYEMAYGWSHNVDITFVSYHTLKNPVFTNERVENFTIYNDSAFSVEVYLEKNMVVNGKDKVDIMHDRLYFVYYENGYKLVDMESI